MSTDANRSWVAACRRRLAAALCVLMLLTGLLPIHAGAQAALAGFDQVPVSAVVEPVHDGEVPAAPDAVSCHLACHCACKIAVLPDAAVRRTSLLVRPALFAVSPSHALRPGLLAPPSEPPRT